MGGAAKPWSPAPALQFSSRNTAELIVPFLISLPLPEEVGRNLASGFTFKVLEPKKTHPKVLYSFTSTARLMGSLNLACNGARLVRVKRKNRLSEVSYGGNLQQGYMCVHISPDGMGFSRGFSGYPEVSVSQCHVCVEDGSCRLCETGIVCFRRICPEDSGPAILRKKRWIMYLWPEF